MLISFAFVIECLKYSQEYPLLETNSLTRKGGNYSDVLPLKAAWHDSIWGLQIWAADEPNSRVIYRYRFSF